MTDTSLAQKLHLRSAARVAIVNGPAEAEALLGDLPPGSSTLTGPEAADATILFVHNRAELAREWPAVQSELGDDPLLWVAYPKKSAAVSTDLSRDRGWEPIIEAGLDAVSQVSIDQTWSALRFRRDPRLRAARAARGRPGPGHSSPA